MAGFAGQISKIKPIYQTGLHQFGDADAFQFDAVPLPSMRADDPAQNDRGPISAQATLPDAADSAIIWVGDLTHMLWADGRHADVTPFSSPGFAKGGGGGGGSTGGGSTGTLYTSYSSGSADGQAGYDIVISFKGIWTVDLQSAFIKAANYFTTLITTDIGGGAFVRTQYVDDLFITAELKAIDGVGGILGQAGPTAIWTASELTATGQMQFDSADAQSYFSKGLWDDIVFHEMMHTLGFGSLWNYGTNPLVTTAGQYTGAAGLAAYQALAGNSGATFIPVETGGGAGTAGSHWSESALGNELMTGYINSSNYVSTFSIASLADLGYKLGSTDVFIV